MAFNLDKNETTASATNSSDKASTSKFNLAKNDAPAAGAAQKTGQSKKWLFALLGLLVAGGAGWYLLSGSKQSSGSGNNTEEAIASDTAKKIITAADTALVLKTQTDTHATVAKTVNNETVSTTAAALPASALNNQIPASFAKGSTSPNDIDEMLVRNIIVFLQQNPAASITINGYASSEGTIAINQEISQLRATAFKQILVSKGIAANRIITTGKGTDNPIAPNETEEGRQKNRRAEVVLQ